MNAEQLTEHYCDLVRQVVEGRKVVLALGVLASCTRMIERLGQLGATDFFCLADSVGTGELPADRYESHIVGDGSGAMMEVMRSYQAALADLPAEVRQRLNEFDPDEQAVVIAAFWCTVPAIGGRPVLGARPDSWCRLEDKLVVDELWDDVGVPRAGSRVGATDAPLAKLMQLAHEVDEGDGTVWVGDASEGFHGGAKYARIVRSRDDGERAQAFLGRDCRELRIMPFLEGIPCSIHGMVMPSRTIAFRPLEMVVFRRPCGVEFVYAGCASYWDPPASDRQAMRASAVAVGEHLRRTVSYRGAFTIDGVMTRRGFLPTELNPRWGAGLNVLAASLQELPFSLVDKLIKAGLEMDFCEDELERIVLEAADAQRAGGSWTLFDASPPIAESFKHPLAWTGAGYRLASASEEPIAHLLVGPSNVGGGYIRFNPEPGHLDVGRSVAPRARQVFAFADEHLGANVGPLEPAVSVR